MDLLDDERFAGVAKDPRFRRVPKQERKVKIDKRFEGMFTDKRFKLKYSVDKRGRPENRSSSENLRKFYELSESDNDDDADENERGEDDSDDSVNIVGDDELPSQNENRTISRDRHKRETDASNQQCSKKERRKSGRELIREFKRKRAQAVLNREMVDGDRQTAVSPKFSQVSSESDIKSTKKPKIPKRGETTINSEEFEDDSSSDESESGLGSDESPRKKSKTKNSKAALGPSWQKRIGIDLARGEGNIETSSSESESEDGAERGDDAADKNAPVTSAVEGLDHGWGELDTDAPRTENVSRRLAICNMDWDRVTATDLFVMLNSFKPAGGVLHAVKIYPSEFGLQRMKEEDAKGPQELVQKETAKTKPDGVSEGRYHQEKLRKYQMQRLKYYYAVAECDTVDTASAVYDQCDGMEYESSSARLDLRFIPDDMTFDHEPRDVAMDVPDVAAYKPTEFQTTALHQSRVELTWDETDKKRIQKTTQAFSKKNMEEMETDMRAYLASSSEEEEDDDGDEQDASGLEEEEVAEERPMREEDRINKYRNLLRGIEEKEKQDKEDKDMEMEITWEPGLKETTEEIVKKKSEVVSSTPWEKYLEKRKEKRKDRKEEQKKKKEQLKMSQQAPGEEGLAFSDDDLPVGVDLDDPFFRDSLKDMGRAGNKGKTKSKARKEVKMEEESEEEKQRKAALELLMLDEGEEGRQHFNLKDIVENDNMTKSKRKRQQRKLGKAESVAVAQDNFKIDTKDPRFDALFTSHEYAIDPSDPHFKKTKGMDALITEKQERRRRKEMAGGDDSDDDDEDVVEKKKKREGAKKKDVTLSQLVKSIKNKTEQYHARKKMKVNL